VLSPYRESNLPNSEKPIILNLLHAIADNSEFDLLLRAKLFMSVTTYTIRHLILSSWLTEAKVQTINPLHKSLFPDFLLPIRERLNHLEIKTPQFAHHLCKLIPAQCPFARKLTLFGQTLLTIPPLCKINPLYEELMMLRFRALSYLADECGEDISQYC
jgi:hypothetical protein